MQGRTSETAPGERPKDVVPSFWGMPYKYIALVLLVLQNTSVVLLMRYSRTVAGPMYSAATVVVNTEIMKMLMCCVILHHQLGGLTELITHVHENLFVNYVETIKMSVPACLYVIQNNLLYIAISNLDAATFQVTYQMKILMTVVFSIIVFGRQVSPFKWTSLVVLVLGVAVVQLQSEKPKSSVVEQNPFKGLVAVTIACVSSGFAGVYFEKMVKQSTTSVWMRNIQLALWSLLFGAAPLVTSEWESVSTNGYLYGYNIYTFYVLMLQAFGGLVVAVVIKYADNILKGFATSIAIVLSCVFSVFFFDFQLTAMFLAGTSMVLAATQMWAMNDPFAKPAAEPSSRA